MTPGAAAGFTGAVLNGANLMQTVKATFTGAFWGAASAGLNFLSADPDIAAKLFKHAFSNMWLEGVRGGNMKHGLLSGLASAAGGSAIEKYGLGMSRAVKVAANAVVGGAAEELGGGKFANGAITGAFSMLFNDLMHGEEDPSSNENNGVGQPGEWEELIPLWGSGRSSIDFFQTGHPWKGTLHAGLAVSDVFLVKSLAVAATKGTITLAGKYALKRAVTNPQMTMREVAAAVRNPSIAPMMRGKGIDRAFRSVAENNFILRTSSSMGILTINPTTRGADMVGRGVLKSTWWDVTTPVSWGSHVQKYGSGGIGLFY